MEIFAYNCQVIWLHFVEVTQECHHDVVMPNSRKGLPV